MGAGDNKTLMAACAGCGKEYSTQRHANVPEITGYRVRLEGTVRSVPLCRKCVEKGIKPEDALKPAETATEEQS
jgi:hypothetical protein